MQGSLPAGAYVISAEGYQPSYDAMVHIDILLRHPGAADHIIVSADSNVPKGSDAGAPGGIETTVQGAATTAACGDLLVMRAKMVSGTSDFIEFDVNLTIP